MEAVEGSARTDWNGLEIDGPYVAEIVRWLGEDQARVAWRKFLKQNFIHTPAIRSNFEGASRLFGLSVGALVRVAPLGFSQGFRGFGEMQVTLDGQEATVEIVELPPGILPYLDAYGVLFHGLFLGIYDVVDAEPHLTFQVDRANRQIVAHFRW